MDTAPNTSSLVGFSGEFVTAQSISNVQDLAVEGQAIVVNLADSPAIMGEAPASPIPPRCSTILKDTSIRQADYIALLTVNRTENIGSIILEEGWQLLGDILGPASPFPCKTPLWRSSQHSIGIIEADPRFLCCATGVPAETQAFDVMLNLWWAPESTTCFIHNQHDFIEVHTQVYGRGRMQKFHEQRAETLYEDLLMPPGYTTPVPFCCLAEDGYEYPWHQYWADTDCIWMAIEYHPVKQ